MSIEEIAYTDRDDWLKKRRELGIGGSEAGAVVGMNPYMSAFELWMVKTGRKEEFAGNIATKVGSYLEELVAEMFCEETGKKVRKKNRILVNGNCPWAFADVDRFVVGERSILECKTTTSPPLMRKLRNSEEFPEQYLCQCVHYLAVTGAEKCYLAVLIANREFKVYVLERDEAEIDALMTAEAEFWDLVKYDTPPAPDGSDSSSEAVSALFPQSTDATIDVCACDGLLTQYVDLKAQIKTLTEMADACANKVKLYMKDAGRGESDRFKVSYATTSRKSFDADAFRKVHKDIDLGDFYKESTSRTFKVTKKGE